MPIESKSGGHGTGPTFPPPAPNRPQPADSLATPVSAVHENYGKEGTQLSDFLEAYDYVMSSEDPWHEFRTVQDYGAQSISGINSAYWPKDFAAINALPIAQRGLAVENFYRDNYWNGKNFQLLSSQRLANYTMDADVNQGDGAKMLQMAADRLGATLIVDGVIGLLTLQAVNAMNPITLLDSFLVVRMDEYRDSIARNPEKAASLSGWTARAKKLGL